MASRPRRTSSKLLWLLVSLSLTLTITVVLAMAFTPTVVRWVYVNRLESPDKATRMSGAAYVCRHAADDEALRVMLRRRLADPQSSDDTRRAMIAGLRCAEIWGPDFGDHWVRWLDERATDTSTMIRRDSALALTRAGLDGHPVVNSDAATALLERLLRDDAAVVRRMALRAAATRVEPGRSALVRMALDDANPAVARQAWIIMGLSAGRPDSPSLPLLPSHEDMLDMPARLSAAILWARARDPGDRGATALILHHEPQTPDDLRAWLPYALGSAPGRWWAVQVIEAMHQPIETEFDRLAVWRALVAAPISRDGYADPARIALGEFYRAAADTESIDPLAAVAASHLASGWGRFDHAQALLPLEWTGDPARAWRELAILESLPTESVDLYWEGTMPRLAVASAIRVAKQVDPLDVTNALDADAAAARHMAVLSVVDRYDTDHVNTLADPLLHRVYDNQRRSAALLVGYAGGDANLLRQRLPRETVWAVIQHLKLGLFMLDEDSQFDPTGLLIRSDIPRSAVLWTLLHAGMIEGLDELFDPVGPDSPILRRELDTERFWYVLRRYLPEEAPTFSVWADPDLQQLQADQLRTWYLMNRARLSFDQNARRFVLTR